MHLFNRRRIMPVLGLIAATGLLLGACDTGSPAAVGATLSGAGAPLILVNLCSGARVTQVTVTDAVSGAAVWRVDARTPSAKTSFVVGQEVPGFTTTIGRGVRLDPKTYYAAFAQTASGGGGNQVPAFYPKDLRQNLVVTSEPQGLVDLNPKPIPESAFWSGPCRE